MRRHTAAAVKTKIRQPPQKPAIRSNIRKLYVFSFLQMTLFPMAIITLFWKDQIGLSLTSILLLQGIFFVTMVVMEYPSGYVSDRIGYWAALNFAALFGVIGWGFYVWADSFSQVMVAEIILGISISFISGTDSALLFESLKANGEGQHYAYHEGRMSGFGQIGEVCGALFAGVLCSAFPLLPFLIQIVVWVLALLLTGSLVEPQRKLGPIAGHLVEALKSTRYVLLENKHLRYTILLNPVACLSTRLRLYRPGCGHARRRGWIQRTFLLLCLGFATVLPSAAWLFLHHSAGDTQTTGDDLS